MSIFQAEANAATQQQQQMKQAKGDNGSNGLGAGEGGKGKGNGKDPRLFIPRDALMARANSLKKAVRSILDMTEREVDTQARVAAESHSVVPSAVSSEDPLQDSPNLSPCSSHSSLNSEEIQVH